MNHPLPKRVVAEALGTAMLLAAVVGSGIMGERLAAGNTAMALLVNTLAGDDPKRRNLSRILLSGDNAAMSHPAWEGQSGCLYRGAQESIEKLLRLYVHPRDINSLLTLKESHETHSQFNRSHVNCTRSARHYFRNGYRAPLCT